MGNLCFPAKRTERRLNHSPDEQIQQKPKKSSRKEANGQLVRFFMTGMGSAGKTTIIRQLHLLCNRNPNYKLCDEDWRELGGKGGANAQMEQRVWARQIRKNVVDIFDILIKFINEKGGGKFEFEKNRKFAEKIEEICEEGNWQEIEENLEEMRKNLVELFKDGAVKEAKKHRNKIEIDGKKLFDGCEYFLQEERIQEIFSQNFVASDEAKVHSRNPTAEMSTYRFKLNKTRIEITDVGGQKSELVKMVDYLRNWSFNCGQENNLNFILLVVGMSDYNEKHQKYEGSTLLDECVEYLKVLMNNKIAQQCGLLIFFNKKDRFREKLTDPECRKDISFLAPYLPPKHAREYLAKGKFDERQMGDALASKFVEAIKEMKEREKDTYCRFTCAIDTKMMEGIFGAIKEDILNENILNVFP